MLNLAVRVSKELHTYTWKMDPPAYWKPSLEVPFFLKPATLVFDSSLHRNLLIENLKKQLECSTSAVQTVETSPGKECDFMETCRSLRDTLDTEEKPLFVSFPLSKIPRAPGVANKSADSPAFSADTLSSLSVANTSSLSKLLSKEARKTSFDAHRNRRIAAMMRDNSEDSDYDSDSKTDDSHDSSDGSDSESEYSDDSDDTADKDIDGEYNIGAVINITLISFVIICILFWFQEAHKDILSNSDWWSGRKSYSSKPQLFWSS